MAIKNVKDFRSFKNRRAERVAARGVELENTVEMLLCRMQEAFKISRFIRHPHNSPEDASGKDFTVFFVTDGKESSHSFGVTISLKSWNRGKVNHRNVTQFCWPSGTNLETMEKRILELSSKKHEESK